MKQIGGVEVEKFLDMFDGDSERAIEAIRRYAAAATQSVAVTPQPLLDTPIIVELHDVVKTYKLGRQNVDALRGATLSIRQGEFIAVTGPSGSGKSTLLQLIGALDAPTSGRVIIDGTDLSKLRDNRLAMFRSQTIGFVFQFFYLQPFLSLESNIEVPAMFARTARSARRQRAHELADKTGLMDRLKHYPKELSGGQMQRAAVARALVNSPKLLLADEPTGNLDRANSTAIINLFETIRDQLGTTVVIVTHDQEIARRADRIISVDDGRVVG